MYAANFRLYLGFSPNRRAEIFDCDTDVVQDCLSDMPDRTILIETFKLIWKFSNK